MQFLDGHVAETKHEGVAARLDPGDHTAWPATKAKLVFAALLRIGWRVKRQRGSHRVLAKPGWPDYIFAYHDRVEVGRAALELLGKRTGLRPEDL